jgi:proteasome lid subunit RPN8/RPN11
VSHPRLTTEALQAMYAHARQEYPKECCGIVFGPKASEAADEARACRNNQDDLHAADPTSYPRDARTAYNLESRDLFALEKSLRGERPAKIIYHSHVDVGAYFSPTDQAAALFEGEPAHPVEYVVIDVKADGTHGAAQFAWDETQKSYVEVDRYDA